MPMVGHSQAATVPACWYCWEFCLGMHVGTTPRNRIDAAFRKMPLKLRAISANYFWTLAHLHTAQWIRGAASVPNTSSVLAKYTEPQARQKFASKKLSGDPDVS